MKDIWIEVCFNDQPMDNVIAHTEEEAKEIIQSIEQNGFSEYNEDVKNDWLEMGFNDNPKVTAYIIKGWSE